MALSIRLFEDISEIPVSGLALFQDAEQASFDLGADWFRLLTEKALPERAAGRYYVLMDADKVFGILPLLLRERQQLTGLTTFYTSLYRPLFAEGLTVDAFAGLIRRAVGDAGAGSLRLDAMSPEHPSYELAMASMRAAGLRVYRFFSHGNWYLPSQGLSYEDYFRALPTRVRNTVVRREKKFLGDGRGRVEMIAADGGGLDQAISAWNRVYAASWKKPEPFPGFMPGLIHLCMQRRWLRMAIAYRDEVPIAAQIWIVNGGRAAIYKLAYDQAYARHSAGTLLTARLMRHVLNKDRVNEVDYLVGDDNYKRDWVSHRRERWGLIGYNPRTFRGLGGAAMQELGGLWRLFSKTEN